jgi:hypothetical protein
MTTTKLTALYSALLLMGGAPLAAVADDPAAAAVATPAADKAASAAEEDSGPGVVIAEAHAGDGEVAAKPAPLPPWSATLRAGAFVLRSPGISGHPAGPDVELSLGRIIYDLVSVEANLGYYGTSLTGTGTELRVVPLTVSLKLTAAPEHGIEPYAVAGLGVDFTKLTGGTLAASSTATIAFHAGLGARYRFGARYYTGLDARYVFQDVSGPAQRLDGLRLSVMGGALF